MLMYAVPAAFNFCAETSYLLSWPKFGGKIFPKPVGFLYGQTTWSCIRVSANIGVTGVHKGLSEVVPIIQMISNIVSRPVDYRIVVLILLASRVGALGSWGP